MARDPRDLVALVREIEELVKTRNAMADPEASQRIEAICFKIQHSELSTAYARGKCSKIESRAAIYFSAREHVRYAAGEISGAHHIRTMILGECMILRAVLAEAGADGRGPS